MLKTFLKEKDFIIHKLVSELGEISTLGDFDRILPLTPENTIWTDEEIPYPVTDRYNNRFLEEFQPYNNAQITVSGKFNFYREETLVSPEINVVCDTGEHNIIRNVPRRPFGNFRITSLERFSTRICILFYRVKNRPYIWDIKELGEGEEYIINDSSSKKYAFLLKGELKLDNKIFEDLKCFKITSTEEKVFQATQSSIFLYVRSDD